MDKFEQQFEDLDVQTGYMENSIGQTTAQTTPQDQVDDLIQKVADENGLELQMELPGLTVSSSVQDSEQEALNARLARLRNP
jgi:charged multivesicular body protein 1